MKKVGASAKTWIATDKAIEVVKMINYALTFPDLQVAAILNELKAIAVNSPKELIVVLEYSLVLDKWPDLTKDTLCSVMRDIAIVENNKSSTYFMQSPLQQM